MGAPRQSEPAAESQSPAAPSSDARPEGAAEALEAEAEVSLGSFEQSVRRLAAIVDSLEQGEQPLEESLRLFEEGMTLARRSQSLLNQAEQRIERLLDVGVDGEPVTRELDAEPV